MGRLQAAPPTTNKLVGGLLFEKFSLSVFFLLLILIHRKRRPRAPFSMSYFFLTDFFGFFTSFFLSCPFAMIFI